MRWNHLPRLQYSSLLSNFGKTWASWRNLVKLFKFNLFVPLFKAKYCINLRLKLISGVLLNYLKCFNTGALKFSVRYSGNSLELLLDPNRIRQTSGKRERYLILNLLGKYSKAMCAILLLFQLHFISLVAKLLIIVRGC
jgi:hypothetical protein